MLGVTFFFYEVGFENVVCVRLVSLDVFVVFVYRPPSNTFAFIQNLTSFILQFCEGKEVILVGDQTGKTNIRCPTDYFPWHNGGPINHPLTPQYDSALMHGGFQGALNWASRIPRDASLSDSYTPDHRGFSCLGWRFQFTIS